MLELVALRARPDLLAQVFAPGIQGTWPDFMRHDAAAQLYFGKSHLDACLGTAFAVVDPARPDVAVGRAFAVPFALADVPGRTELPDAGWDGVIRWAHQDRALGRAADALSALDITLRPSPPRARRVPPHPGRAARARGRPGLQAPVRPRAAHGEAPRTVRADGRVRRAIDRGRPARLPLAARPRPGRGADREGGPDQHRGRGQHRRLAALDRDGVRRLGVGRRPGRARARARSLEQDHAVYVEPNVWVRHAVPG